MPLLDKREAALQQLSFVLHAMIFDEWKRRSKDTG